MNFNQIRLSEITRVNENLIIHFQENAEKTKYLHLSNKFIQDFYLNHLDSTLEDLVRYYIYSHKSIEINKLQKSKSVLYELKDFDIQELDRRICGNYAIIYVCIKNIKSGYIFEDWVKPSQIDSLEKLNNLIFWDIEGEDLLFNPGLLELDQIEKKKNILLDVK